MSTRDWNERDHPRDKNNQKFVKKEGSDIDSNNIHLTKSDYRDTLKKPTAVMLPKKLYAEFDSIIRTKYADKIPKNGYITCYNPIEGYNYYMQFAYDKGEERIICTRLWDLDRDEEEIKLYLKEY